MRQHLQGAIDQRLLEPFRRRLLTGKGCYWLGSNEKPVQNNWNAVCLSGVVGAALMTIPDKNERANYVAAGEHYSQNFLHSFGSDGYCTEGVGYWGYGFGHYAILREEIVTATGGKIDLFSNPLSTALALYGIRIQIGDKTAPAFSDCPFGSTPNRSLLAYCNDVLKLGLKYKSFLNMNEGLAGILMAATPYANRPASDLKPEDPLRSFFDKAGVLVCRAGAGSASRLGIAIKAGGNFSHSHNDIGSYVIALGEDEPTGDPGGPDHYDSETFSPKRYDRAIFNSYGHPVPLIAGQKQILATDAKPAVLSTSFTPKRDEIKMDITSAYAVPALKQLTRTMDYDRTDAGGITITDEAAFTEKTTFEDALITRGTWKQLDPETILLTIGTSTISVTVKSPQGGITLKPEVIKERNSPEFTRIGLVLKEPVEAAQIQMEFRPAP